MYICRFKHKLWLILKIYDDSYEEEKILLPFTKTNSCDGGLTFPAIQQNNKYDCIAIDRFLMGKDVRMRIIKTRKWLRMHVHRIPKS